jgi:hypothetical protein
VPCKPVLWTSLDGFLKAKKEKKRHFVKLIYSYVETTDSDLPTLYTKSLATRILKEVNFLILAKTTNQVHKGKQE